MTNLNELQDWYLSQCNEEWEHSYGISIGTFDNPGWSLEIDLIDTSLENVTFEEQSYGVGEDAEEGSHDWIICRVTEHKFVGDGGPKKIGEMIEIFLSWAKRNA
jgi:hypothetical protein